MERVRTDIMGMPIRVVAAGGTSPESVVDDAFAYLEGVDARFSTYKEDSEISKINRGEVPEADYSDEMKEVLAIGEDAKRRTGGYFDVRRPDGTIDPSGVVKGWALLNAHEVLKTRGVCDSMIDIAGDIASSGTNEEGSAWALGIRNPFAQDEIVKVVYPQGKGVATSGSYARGAHIYDPVSKQKLEHVASVTVIARDVLEADLLATASFAMGENGIAFLESLPDVEGYQIAKDGTATMTSGFHILTLSC